MRKVSSFITSCKGQTSTSQPTNHNQLSTITDQHPKIIRTLGAKNENVVCQLIDKDGKLWFSVIGEGAYRYDGKSFTNITTKDGFCNNKVTAIIQDSAGNIFLGTKKKFAIMMVINLRNTKYQTP